MSRKGDRGFRLLLRHDGWGTATLQSGASNRATGDSRLRGNDEVTRHEWEIPAGDSRLRRPLHNLFEGMGMESGARKMNGGTMGRASQNNHSA